MKVLKFFFSIFEKVNISFFVLVVGYLLFADVNKEQELILVNSMIASFIVFWLMVEFKLYKWAKEDVEFKKSMENFQ